MLVWGVMIRAGHDGRLCSGDYYNGDINDAQPYQWESGKFILVCLIYQVIEAIVMTVLNSYGNQHQGGVKHIPSEASDDYVRQY